MQVGKYLEVNQPIIYKTFINSLREDKLSHAYLLVGDPGTPLKEVATYLAKSLVCDAPDGLYHPRSPADSPVCVCRRRGW